MNVLGWLIPLLALVVVLGGLFLVATANRLDRLHVRTDAGWAALEAALARRAVVARAIALVLGDTELRTSAERAEAAPRAASTSHSARRSLRIGRSWSESVDALVRGLPPIKATTEPSLATQARAILRLCRSG